MAGPSRFKTGDPKSKGDQTQCFDEVSQKRKIFLQSGA
jgi:hypothetical protein